jgi:diguanylate cyclase (GGDEF)-like protein
MGLGFETGNRNFNLQGKRTCAANSAGRARRSIIPRNLLTGASLLPIWRPLKSLTVPGGVLLFGVMLLTYLGWMTLALPSLTFLYYCALIGGMLLAWRFRSSRVFLALLVLFLAGQALSLAAIGHTRAYTAFDAVAVLVPLNFILIAAMQERGFTATAMAPAGVVLFVQCAIVAVLLQSGEAPAIHPHHPAATIVLPGYVLVSFSVAAVTLLIRSLLTRKPVDSSLLWSLVAFFLAMHYAGTTRLAAVYSATAACILAVSIIETSYLLAYHDELTTLPSRRAFNDALLCLQEPYSIAVVDIDHFKRFNDTYGHDTGDEVLRLVASNLSRVTGGGQAYRCGGEEFAILFPGKTIADVLDHLEKLRVKIETSEFHMRHDDRRQIPRGPDRRTPRSRGRGRAGHAIRQLAEEKTSAPLSVTVSMGVAASGKNNKVHPDAIVQAADKALYRAKANGRNRIEISSDRRRARAKTAGIA